jgi:hypothetical protein
MSVSDSRANLAEYTKRRGNNGGSGYPLLRLSALVARSTRTVIDVVFGPTATGEIIHADRLARTLRAGMILLLDRNFAARDLITTLTTTGTQILVRLKTGRVRSYRSWPATRRLLPVHARRDESPGDRCRDHHHHQTGRHTGTYRLATTVLDHHRHPPPIWSRSITSDGSSRPPTWNSDSDRSGNAALFTRTSRDHVPARQDLEGVH